MDDWQKVMLMLYNKKRKENMKCKLYCILNKKYRKVESITFSSWWQIDWVRAWWQWYYSRDIIDGEVAKWNPKEELLSLNDCVILWNTWLKDRNWVDIYDWDILKSYSDFSPELTTYCVVAFDNGGFYKMSLDYKHIHNIDSLDEIIWNINDLPEVHLY